MCWTFSKRLELPFGHHHKAINWPHQVPIREALDVNFNIIWDPESKISNLLVLTPFWLRSTKQRLLKDFTVIFCWYGRGFLRILKMLTGYIFTSVNWMYKSAALTEFYPCCVLGKCPKLAYSIQGLLCSGNSSWEPVWSPQRTINMVITARKLREMCQKQNFNIMLTLQGLSTLSAVRVCRNLWQSKIPQGNS